MPSKRALGGVVVPCIAISALAAGCSSPPSLHGAPTAASTPGGVAVAYARDLFSGQWQAARPLVLPQDRNTFDVLAAVIHQNTVSARDVSVGTENASGNTATIVLKGRFCTASGAAQSAATACITNSNPNASNKALTVALTHYAGHWYVYYPCGRAGARKCPS